MKYDPIELMKLDLTEESIQTERDRVLKVLTTTDTQFAVLLIAKDIMPFVVDMLQDNTYTSKDWGCGCVKITITL